MIKQDQSAKYAKSAYKGPYIITEVHNNGTVDIKRGNFKERINIRRLKRVRN